MLSRYFHVRTEAKQRALDEIAARQRAADERREDGRAATAAQRNHHWANCGSIGVS
jgi:hypothetical protein